MLTDVVCGDGVVYVASWAAALDGDGRFGPARVVALRARDGTAIWQVDPPHIRRQTAGMRLKAYLRATLPCGLNLVRAWQTARSLGLLGYIYLRLDGDALIACSGEVIFGFDGRSGALRWTFATIDGRHGRLMAAAGGKVFVNVDSLETPGFCALDARSGRRLWRCPDVVPLTVLAADAAHVDVDSVVRPGRKAHGRALVAVRAADGTIEWTLSRGNEPEYVAALAVDGTAYLVRGAQLWAVRGTDSVELWRVTVASHAAASNDQREQIWLRVALTGTRLFYACAHCAPAAHRVTVGALEATTGRTRWRWQGPERPAPLRNGVQLVAAPGRVYLRADKEIVALDGDDGRLLWHLPAGFDSLTMAAVIV